MPRNTAAAASHNGLVCHGAPSDLPGLCSALLSSCTEGNEGLGLPTRCHLGLSPNPGDKIPTGKRVCFVFNPKPLGNFPLSWALLQPNKNKEVVMKTAKEMLAEVLKPQPQGWESFCTCVSSSEIAGGAHRHGPRSKHGAGQGTPQGLTDCPELSIRSEGGELLSHALPGVKQSTRQLRLFISYKRSLCSARDALRAAEMKFPKPSLGPEAKLFPRFRLGPSLDHAMKEADAFPGIAKG